MRLSLLLLSSALFIAPLMAADAPPATQPAGTRVNIHMPQAEPEDVFNELAKQGGVKFIQNNNLWEQEAMQMQIDAEFADQPFWSAVRSVCMKLNLQPSPDYSGNSGARRIQLNQNGGQWGTIPVYEADGFMVQAMSYNRQQNVNYSKDGGSQNYCNIQLMVYADPGLRVQSFNSMAKTDLAMDDAGNNWTPDKGDPNRGGFNNQRSIIYNCQAPLKYPANPGKKLTQFKCTLTLRAGEKVETMTVEKPVGAAETSKQMGNYTVTLQSVTKKDGGNYEVKLSLTKDDDNNDNNVYNLIQAAQLLDENGRPYNYQGGGGGGGNGTYEYTINYGSNNNRNTGKGEPAKWLLEMPTQVKTIKVPVEFKDLPLP